MISKEKKAQLSSQQYGTKAGRHPVHRRFRLQFSPQEFSELTEHLKESIRRIIIPEEVF